MFCAVATAMLLLVKIIKNNSKNNLLFNSKQYNFTVMDGGCRDGGYGSGGGEKQYKKIENNFKILNHKRWKINFFIKKPNNIFLYFNNPKVKYS